MNGASQISVIVPAAGRSKRMGSRNKLLLPLGRRSVLERVVTAVLGADPLEVIVVTGPERDRIEATLTDHPVQLIHNPDFIEGMASSLRAGVGTASLKAAGFAIVLGDLPFIRSSTISDVCSRLEPGRIIIPYFKGRQGHPVVFAAEYRHDLLALSGDVGARSVVRSHADATVVVETNDPGILFDVDTMADFRRGRAGA